MLKTHLTSSWIRLIQRSWRFDFELGEISLNAADIEDELRYGQDDAGVRFETPKAGQDALNRAFELV